MGGIEFLPYNEACLKEFLANKAKEKGKKK